MTDRTRRQAVAALAAVLKRHEAVPVVDLDADPCGASDCQPHTAVDGFKICPETVIDWTCKECSRQNGETDWDEPKGWPPYPCPTVADIEQATQAAAVQCRARNGKDQCQYESTHDGPHHGQTTTWTPALCSAATRYDTGDHGPPICERNSGHPGPHRAHDAGQLVTWGFHLE